MPHPPPLENVIKGLLPTFQKGNSLGGFALAMPPPSGSSGVSSDRPPGVSFSGVSLVQKPGQAPTPKAQPGQGQEGASLLWLHRLEPLPTPHRQEDGRGRWRPQTARGGLAGQATSASPRRPQAAADGSPRFHSQGSCGNPSGRVRGTRRGFLLGLRAWASQFSSSRALLYPSLRPTCAGPSRPAALLPQGNASLLWREPVR